MRTAVELATDTGRRPEEICELGASKEPRRSATGAVPIVGPRSAAQLRHLSGRAKECDSATTSAKSSTKSW
jgi:hypothetical protein